MGLSLPKSNLFFKKKCLDKWVHFSGKLNEYLHEVDEECHKILDQLVEQMKEKQGVTEQLKADNQMLWVGKMNNIIACAEEIVVREVVYV